MTARTSAEVAIQVAAHHVLGVRVVDCELVSAGRTHVYRARLDRPPTYRHGNHRPSRLDARTGPGAGEATGGSAPDVVVAARVTSAASAHVSHEREAAGWLTDPDVSQGLIYVLSGRGVRVATPLHPELVATPAGFIGFWDWLRPAPPLTATEWGRLTGHLHARGTRITRLLLLAGSRTAGSIAGYDPLSALAARMRIARHLAGRRGHPLHSRHHLLRRLETAVENAVGVARAATAASPAVLAHGDNQPGNILRTHAGTPVLTDFERITWGPPALDWAALLLGRRHYGFTDKHLRDFHAGYLGRPRPDDAPTHATGGADVVPSDPLEAALTAEPFARIRELSGVLVAMLRAGESPVWEQEMATRLAAVTDPATGTDPHAIWTFIGSPDDMRLADPRPVDLDSDPTGEHSGHPRKAHV